MPSIRVPFFQPAFWVKFRGRGLSPRAGRAVAQALGAHGRTRRSGEELLAPGQQGRVGSHDRGRVDGGQIRPVPAG